MLRFIALLGLAESSLLFVGDSTVRALGPNNWATVRASVVFGDERVHFVGNAGINRHCTSLPSTCTPEMAVRNAGLRDGAQRAGVRAVLLNFAGLHLLHMFPHRPWWHEDKRVSAAANKALQAEVFKETLANCTKATQLCYYADFDGFARLEAWIERDVAAYRELLPNARVVLATPNWVCDERYHGYYSWLTTTAEGRRASAESCGKFLAARDGWPRVPKWACERSQQSSLGTVALSSRIRRKAEELNVPVVDFNKITLDQCAHTKDGRHYDATIVKAQLEALRAVVGSGPSGAVEGKRQPFIMH